jgi:hypothetical protein
MMEEKYIGRGGAMKRIGEGQTYGGYLVKFTDAQRRDLHGEYFNDETEFYLDVHKLDGKPVLYEHGMDETVRMIPLGHIKSYERRADGIYAEFDLTFADNYMKALRPLEDASTEWAQRQRKIAEEYQDEVSRMLEDGTLGWSSGAFPQSVEVDKSGHIKSWALIEGSATPQAAMPYDTMIVSAKSLKGALDGLSVNAQAQSITSVKNRLTALENEVEEMASKNKKMLTPEIIQEALDELKATLVAKMEMGDDEAQRMTEEAKMEIDALDEEEVLRANDAEKMEEEDAQEVILEALEEVVQRSVEKALTRRQKARARMRGMGERLANKAVDNAPIPASTLPSATKRISVSEPQKYAHLTANQMALGFQFLQSTLPSVLRNTPAANSVVSEEYLTTMANKAVREMERQPFSDVRDTMAVKNAMPFKADEINATNIAGQGQEWVGVLYGTSLWERARNEVTLLRMLRERGMFEQEIPQGFGSVEIPTEGADPIAYSTPQANDKDATNRVEVTANIGFFGTGKVTLTPGQIKIAAATTDELTEDSVIPVLPNMERQMTVSALEQIERALLNGDTATAINTNINLIDGTPGTGINRPYYLAVNGLRKYPLVTNTDYSSDAGGSFSLEDFRVILQEFNPEVQAKLANLLYVMDVYTHNSALAIPEIATDDVRRTNATITSGRVLNVYGIDVLTTGFLGKANIAGKISGTPANNTRGQLLAVYAPYWAFGFKRQVTLEMDKDIASGTTLAVASMRFGFVARGADASAIRYNIGIS